MSLEYKIEAADGSEFNATPEKVVNDLRQIGIESSITPDGKMLHYDIDGVAMEMPVADFLSKTVGPVVGFSFLPDITDFSTVNPELRLGVENLPNDALRQKYLEFSLESQGIESPQIIGMGSDWALYDPGTASYRALTNRPGMDISDIGEIGAAAPRLFGNIVGGVGGAIAGGGITPASVATGAAGTAIGGQIGRGLLDAYLAASQPEYRELLSSLAEEGLGDVLMERVGEAGIDFATGALGGAIPLVPALSKGLVTRGGAAVSSGLQKVGSGGRKIASTIDDPIGRAVGAELAMGTGPIQLGAFLAQSPAWLTRNLPKASQWAKGKLGLQTVTPGSADDLLRGVPVSSSLDDILTKWRNLNQYGVGGGREGMRAATSEEILGRQGEKIGRAVNKWRDARQTQRFQNRVAEDLADVAGGARAGIKSDFRPGGASNAFSRINFETNVGDLGRATGRAFEAAALGGRALERGIEGLMSGIYKTAQVPLYGIEKLGQAGRLGFGALQPLEYRLMTTGGGRLAEEYIPGGTR